MEEWEDVVSRKLSIWGFGERIKYQESRDKRWKLEDRRKRNLIDLRISINDF